MKLDRISLQLSQITDDLNCSADVIYVLMTILPCIPLNLGELKDSHAAPVNREGK